MGALACTLLLIALARSGESMWPATIREASVRPTVRADIQPRTHRFGETVRAQLELVVPTDQIDPATLRGSGNFDPYEVVGAPQRAIARVGFVTVARYTIRLRCLKETCLPSEGTKEFEFPPAGFRWKIPAPPGRRFRDRSLDDRRAGATLPPISVARGISADDLNESRWRSSLATLPAVETRMSAGTLQALLLGGSTALVVGAAGLLAFWTRRELGQRDHAGVLGETPPEPLEQALRLVEAVNGDGDPCRRRLALETLAGELRRSVYPALADDAAELAWAEDAPARDAVLVLTGSVRERIDGAGT